MNKKFIHLLSLLSLFALAACNEFNTDLRVLPRSAASKKLLLNSEKGPLELTPGVYPVRVTLSEKADQASSLVFSDKEKGEIKIPLQLPLPSTVLSTIEPIEISAETLGQPVQLTITREADSGQERINIGFFDPKTRDLVAVAQVFHQAQEPDYEQNAGEFLQSFQRVKYSQRGVYIPIDGQSGDGLTNNSARVLLAPWVYARYNQVEWRIASEDLVCLDPKLEENQIFSHWSSLLRQNSVVDYFAFLRGDSEAKETDPLYFLPKKRNQLRMVYTDAGGTGSALHYIRDFNAGFAAGQSSVSNSPYFGFTSFGFTWARSWTLGMGGTASLLRAFQESKLRDPGTAEPIEPLFSWTSESTWEKAGISNSAVPLRNTEDFTRIYEAKVSELENTDHAPKLTSETAPLELGYNLCALRNQLEPHSAEDKKNGDVEIPRLRLEQLAFYAKALEAKACDK